MVTDSVITIMIILSPVIVKDTITANKPFKINIQELKKASDKASDKATKVTWEYFEKCCLKRKSKKNEAH